MPTDPPETTYQLTPHYTVTRTAFFWRDPRHVYDAAAEAMLRARLTPVFAALGIAEADFGVEVRDYAQQHGRETWSVTVKAPSLAWQSLCVHGAFVVTPRGETAAEVAARWIAAFDAALPRALDAMKARAGELRTKADASQARADRCAAALAAWQATTTDAP